MRVFCLLKQGIGPFHAPRAREGATQSSFVPRLEPGTGGCSAAPAARASLLTSLSLTAARHFLIFK